MDKLIVSVIGLTLARALQAKDAPPAAADPQLEKRVMLLTESDEG